MKEDRVPPPALRLLESNTLAWCERHIKQVFVFLFSMEAQRPAGEQHFVTQKSAERRNQKAPTTAEREPRIKTKLPVAEKQNKKITTQTQNKPRSI